LLPGVESVAGWFSVVSGVRVGHDVSIACTCL